LYKSNQSVGRFLPAPCLRGGGLSVQFQSSLFRGLFFQVERLDKEC